MSVVSEAIAAARAATRAVRGEPITLTHGSTTITIASAVRAETVWSSDPAFSPRPGVKVGDRSIDWLVDVACLLDGSGDAIRPERGTTITDEAGVVYRVMPFGPDNQLWQWHDKTSQSTVRIFTKQRP